MLLDVLHANLTGKGGKQDNAPVEISSDHLIFIFNSKILVPVKNVEVGDTLVSEEENATKVKSISKVTRRGADRHR